MWAEVNCHQCNGNEEYRSVTSLLIETWTEATHKHDPHAAPAFCWECDKEDQDMT